MTTTLYARIEDGKVIEAMVTAAELEQRSVPMEWYTPIVQADIPQVGPHQTLKHNNKVQDGQLYVSYRVVTLSLDELFIKYITTPSEQSRADLVPHILRLGEQAVENVLNAWAQTKGYNGIDRLVSYAASADPVRSQEAQDGVHQRDVLFDAYYGYCEQVTQGIKPVPTGIEKIIAELPTPTWQL
jgi:hypothetical protein